MPNIHYVKVESGEQASVTAFVPGAPRPYTADNTHPNFDRIVAGLKAVPQDEGVIELFDVAETVSTIFEKLSERLAVKDGNIYFDGDLIDNALTQQVVRFLNEDVEDWRPLVYFFENVQQNPQEHSREQLYRWLACRDFTITEDGFFVGYKGVTPDLKSINSGPGIVNGEAVNGHLDNSPGNVVEIARSLVHHDPSVGCSTGLHVGTFAYARGFGSTVLKVVVNPRDVVSVPTDCGDQKVRVCRYEVEDVVEVPITDAFDYDSDPYDYDDEDYWYDESEDEDCCECGDPDCDYYSALD